MDTAELDNSLREVMERVLTTLSRRSVHGSFLPIGILRIVWSRRGCTRSIFVSLLKKGCRDRLQWKTSRKTSRRSFGRLAGGPSRIRCPQVILLGWIVAVPSSRTGAGACLGTDLQKRIEIGAERFLSVLPITDGKEDVRSAQQKVIGVQPFYGRFHRRGGT